MKKAVTKAAPARAPRKVPAKLDVAQAVAPGVEKIAIRKTNTAYAAGFLTCAQQAKAILSHQARSFGEAIEKLHALESVMAGQLSAEIQAELASKRVKIDGRNIHTEATPQGPLIVLKKPELPPEAQKALAEVAATASKQAAAKKAPANAAKKPAAAPVKDTKPEAQSAAPATAKRKYVRRAK